MTFNARYEVDDGYVCGSRPHYFDIDESSIEDDMSEQDLMDLFNEIMYEEFQQSVSPYCTCKQDYLEWCKEVLEKRNETTS